jgi:hypothetical protein
MENRREQRVVDLPDQKNYDLSYGLALKLAAEKLRGSENVENVCKRSESDCVVSGSGLSVRVNYLNRVYQVSWPEIEISSTGTREPVELRDKILILDYLNTAKGTPLTGAAIAFQELPEISNYYPTFVKRAVQPLIDAFGNRPQLLFEAANQFGGQKTSYGDASVNITAFKRVPISYVVWKGDEEFPANANILFDKTIHDYLPNEDIIVLCQTITWRLVKSLKSETNKPET